LSLSITDLTFPQIKIFQYGAHRNILKIIKFGNNPLKYSKHLLTERFSMAF